MRTSDFEYLSVFEVTYIWNSFMLKIKGHVGPFDEKRRKNISRYAPFI